ncbi:MAG: serine--tRNA ligase, partial [Thermomicrobiales bacterium]
MLDITVIRDNPARVKELCLQKNVEAPIDDILALDETRRQTLGMVEELKAKRNVGSKEIGRTKDPEERQRLIADMGGLGDRISELDDIVRDTEADLRTMMLGVPNLPDPDVPVGPDAESNTVYEQKGDLPAFDFVPKPHWEVAEALGIIDFERGVKVAGTRGYIMRGDGARLQRAIVNWMLDIHTERHRYSEVIPPHMVLGESLVGTGSLPKFADTLFRDIEDDKWLIPTAEVPITNMYRD